MMMHKAERKHKVGKVADEEDAKQRQLRAILNNLTYQNLRKRVAQVKAINIDNGVTLYGVVWQIFDRALTEPLFCEMYASLSLHLVYGLPEFTEDNRKINFKRVLLNYCQEEFEREKAAANKIDEEVGKKQNEKGREEKRVHEGSRKLGNIRFIGELGKNGILPLKIIYHVAKELLDRNQFLDEEDVEGLCILMSTIGEMIDQPRAKVRMDAYFEKIVELSKNMKLSSRIRFMLEDVINLRKNNWQPRRKVEGPKQC